MDKREKVIRRIECILNENEMDYGFCVPVFDTVEVLEDALTLLKEQEPEKPIYKQIVNEYEKYTEYINRSFCAKCGAEFIDRVKYCPLCGREVKWDG